MGGGRWAVYGGRWVGGGWQWVRGRCEEGCEGGEGGMRWQSCSMPAGGASRQPGSGISAGWAMRISITRCTARFAV